jgi:uncharacterized protein YcaQ
VVSLDSICYGDLRSKAAAAALIDRAVRRKQLVPVHVEGAEKVQHWAEPAILEQASGGAPDPLVHILSPFDPLVIQRNRLRQFFGYEHRFEAYVPPEKRVLGYFALPVLVGDRIVAAIDLKADRQTRKLLVQKWSWLSDRSPELQASVEEELHRFGMFQLA